MRAMPARPGPDARRCSRPRVSSSRPLVRSGVVSDTEATLTLFRPVGQIELDLIRGLAFRAFPPRLPEQPIFYPVLDESYAVQIARDWNTKDRFSGFAGYVLRFEVRADFAQRYPVQVAGARQHREL